MIEVNDIVYYEGLGRYRAIGYITGRHARSGYLYAMGTDLHNRSASGINELILCAARCVVIGSLNDFEEFQ